MNIGGINFKKNWALRKSTVCVQIKTFSASWETEKNGDNSSGEVYILYSQQRKDN